MKILYIGDAGSRFVRDIAIHVRDFLPPGSVIDIYATEPIANARIPEFDQLFSYAYPTTRLLAKKIKYLYRLVQLRRFLKLHRKQYDLVHVLYALPDLSLMTGLFKEVATRKIVTIFGSDFLEINGMKKNLLGRYLKQSNLVTFANEMIRDTFTGFYHFDQTKIMICRFGLEPLRFIRAIDAEPPILSRAIFKIPVDKVVISIGYNYNPIQQHQQIMDILQASKELQNYRSRLLFLFPMTYGTDVPYRDKIVAGLSTFPFDSMVVDHFLTEHENAHLKRVSDILIQLQRADQFSGSMQESLYAGSLVITGDWLPYDVLEDAGVYFKRIHAFRQLPDVLIKSVQNLPEEKDRCRPNRQIIDSLSSWEHTIYAWETAYQS